jgi:plastocyanin
VRRALLIFFLSTGVATTGSSADDGVIEGTVQLPPPTAQRALNQRYRTEAEAPVVPSNPPAAVVYLEGDLPFKASPPSKAPAVMTQKNLLFAPDLIAIRVGTAVEFPNLDDTYHNVFSYSKPKRFDLGRYRKDEKPAAVIFDQPGVVIVHCEIHDRMRGTILVLNTPFFQKTDSAGHYRFDHLPPGRFVLKAWVDETDSRQQTVDVKRGAKLHVNFPAK